MKVQVIPISDAYRMNYDGIFNKRTPRASGTEQCYTPSEPSEIRGVFKCLRCGENKRGVHTCTAEGDSPGSSDGSRQVGEMGYDSRLDGCVPDNIAGLPF
jgi:hypothetical protein